MTPLAGHSVDDHPHCRSCVFKWNDWRHKHNVVAISAQRFSSCYFGNNEAIFYVLTKASKHGTLKLQASSSKYLGFFTSSVGNDCLRGMKVAMKVEGQSA
ncbi:unnamed protein product [Closterium sp. Naga37s-1]|nr:unnamed protein product [Closterium sp. Naga37s-1]